MCIIVYKPIGKEIDKKILEYCQESNPDGSGFVTAKEGKLVYYKHVGKFSSFWKSYRRKVSKQEEKDLPVLYHFRIKTDGAVNVSNAHPFIFGKNKYAVMHNGRVSSKVMSYTNAHSEKSDTRIFCEEVLNNLPDGWIHNSGICKLITSFISYSRVAAMDNNGNVKLFNEDAFVEEDNIKYSNANYKYMPSTPTYPFEEADKWFRRKEGGRRGQEIIVHPQSNLNRTIDDKTLLSAHKYGHAAQWCCECGISIHTEHEILVGICSHCQSVQTEISDYISITTQKGAYN